MAAEKGLAELTAITASIHQGEGSLGKLIRDDSLHQSLTELSQHGEQTLSSLEDNLAALKETWPLSRYFERRAYLDRDRAVFQPGSARNSRVLASEELFEPGSSVLTAEGRARLDEIARWCNYAVRPSSQIVIAAYTDDVSNRERAEILTQEQADSVRKYLVDKHAIQSAGWFKSRKVAAVGFGAHVPRNGRARASGCTTRAASRSSCSRRRPDRLGGTRRGEWLGSGWHWLCQWTAAGMHWQSQCHPLQACLVASAHITLDQIRGGGKPRQRSRIDSAARAPCTSQR